MKTNARKLRKSLTEAEKKLWYYLRGRNFERLKFRRQYWLASYIVDFICLKKKLIIELDGSQHQEEMQSAHYIHPHPNPLPPAGEGISMKNKLVYMNGYIIPMMK